MVKVNQAALLAVLLTSPYHAAGFTAAPRRGQHFANAKSAFVALSASAEETADISIPYNAAAKLAYDDWKATYPDSTGTFESFEKNYYVATVINVIGKGEYKVTLNEKADQAAAGAAATSPLNTALESAMKQSEASSALGEASEALEEEEQALADALGIPADQLEVRLSVCLSVCLIAIVWCLE